MARPGGLVILVGVNEKETPVVPMRMMLGEVGIKGSLAWTHRDFEMSVDLLASGRIQARPLISATVGLEAIQKEGFERLKTDRSLIKLLVKP
jgi:threonine dehydrogenase-like Zn-dependent dehydrogenase